MSSPKKGIRYITLGIIFFILSPFVVWWINTIATWFKTTTSVKEVDAHWICKGVKHTWSQAYFVPSKTASEWTAFRNNKPSDTALSECVDCEDEFPSVIAWYRYEGSLSIECNEGGWERNSYQRFFNFTASSSQTYSSCQAFANARNIGSCPTWSNWGCSFFEQSCTKEFDLVEWTWCNCPYGYTYLWYIWSGGNWYCTFPTGSYGQWSDVGSTNWTSLSSENTNGSYPNYSPKWARCRYDEPSGWSIDINWRIFE